jgi:hypothetical protein
MLFSPKAKDSEPFNFERAFTEGSLTPRVLRWLRFSSLASPASSRPGVDQLNFNAFEIEHWLGVKPTGAARALVFFPALLAVLLGILTMVGALSYSGDKPVNLWLIIGLFSVLPLMLTMSSAVAALRLSDTTHPGLVELLSLAAEKTNVGVNAQQLLASEAGRSWLFWNVQLSGLIFQSALIVTFFGLLLFNDIVFGWSSTIVQDAGWVMTFFRYFTLPWQWLMAIPSESLINGSQFYRAEGLQNQSQNAALLGAWWPHIGLAMIVYGLLPKLILVGWLYFRANQALQREVAKSVAIERFFQVRNASVSRNPKMPLSETLAGNGERANKVVENAQTASEILNELHLAEQWLIRWQRNISGEFTVALGLESWQKDEDWLKKNALRWRGEVFVVVDQLQIPTAELTDVIALTKRLNSKVKLCLLVLVADGASSKQSARLLNQQMTWRYYAAENCLKSIFVRGLIRGNHTVN